MVRELGAASSTAEQGGLRAVCEALADAGNSGRGKEWDGTNTVVGAGGGREVGDRAQVTQTLRTAPAIGIACGPWTGAYRSSTLGLVSRVACRPMFCGVCACARRTPTLYTLLDTGV